MGEEASEIMDRWTWSGDDAQAVPALLAMPTAHELTEAVLRQCVRNNSLTPATAALVQKYATRHVADDKLRDRVLRVCVLALRYLPSHAVAVLEAIYRFDDFDRQGHGDERRVQRHPIIDGQRADVADVRRHRIKYRLRTSTLHELREAVDEGLFPLQLFMRVI